MPFTARFACLLLALVLVPSAPSSAQSAQAPSGAMTIHVTVDSRSDTPVEGLTQDDFILTDNKKPQPVTAFHAVKDAEPHVIIVLDAVNLPYTSMSYGRQQLAQFFSANDGHLALPTTLAILQDTGLKIQPKFTTNGNELRDLLDKYSIGLRNLPRSSGIEGADEQLQISLRAFEGLISEAIGRGPALIIWISPGWPLLSGPGIMLSPSQQTGIFTSVVTLTTEMRRSEIVVDDVNPLGASQDVGSTDRYESVLRAPRRPQDVLLGNLALQVMATESGGLVLNGSNDIAGLIQHAISESSDGYDLTFTPAPGERPNEYHELHVKLRSSGSTVHTISGYYAHPVYPGFGPGALSPASK